MNFYDERIKSAETVIKIAALLRMFMIAVMAILLAQMYSDKQENLVRVYNEIYNEDKSFFGIIIFGIISDMVLTVSWLHNKKIHTVHMVIYILSGGYFYILYIVDVLNIGGMGFVAALLIYAPVIWVIGLIPFIICGIGRSQLTKAIRDKIEYERNS